MSTFLKETFEIVQDPVPDHYEYKNGIEKQYREDWIRSLLNYMQHGFTLRVVYKNAQFFFVEDPSKNGRVFCFSCSHVLPLVGHTVDWKMITDAMGTFRAYLETKEFVGDSLAMACEPHEAETIILDNKDDSIFMAILEDIVCRGHSPYKVNNYIHVPDNAHVGELEPKMYDRTVYLVKNSGLRESISDT